MNRLALLAAVTAALSLPTAAGATQQRMADPSAPNTSAYGSTNDQMPFPAMMNALFGKPTQPTGARQATQPTTQRATTQRATTQQATTRGATTQGASTQRSGWSQQPQARASQPVAQPSRQLQPVPGFVMPGAGNRATYARPASLPAANNVAALQPPPRTSTAQSVRQFNPAFERKTVAYNGSERPGTIVINTNERFLYLVQGDGTAMRYGVGVGRPGFSWRGTHKVTRKAEWPGWTPPPEMRKRQPNLPAHMKGGPNNPLGARAMYLGSTLYRIHGSNEPWSIGQAVSSGCIRMRNEDVIDLYERVKVGTTVKVI